MGLENGEYGRPLKITVVGDGETNLQTILLLFIQIFIFNSYPFLLHFKSLRNGWENMYAVFLCEQFISWRICSYRVSTTNIYVIISSKILIGILSLFPNNRRCVQLTRFDNLAKSVRVDGMKFSLTLWDTAGQEEYERLRPLSYPKVWFIYFTKTSLLPASSLPKSTLGLKFVLQTDCFLLCFAIDNPASFANVELKWIGELKHHCPQAAILLIGTKSDLRSEKSPNVCITLAEARRLKSKIKANAYIECSAKTQHNLHETFEEAVRAVMKKGSRGPTRVCRFL